MVSNAHAIDLREVPAEAIASELSIGCSLFSQCEGEGVEGAIISLPEKWGCVQERHINRRRARIRPRPSSQVWC